MAVEFEPVWNHPPGHVPSFYDRPPAPRLPRRYPNERDAERALGKILEPYCTLYPQVRITETGYPPQRIDFVAVFKDADAQSSLRLFGIEVKRGFDRVAEACAVIKQAMRYRKARMADPRMDLSRFLGDELPYVAIWPGFDWFQGTDWCKGRPNADIMAAEYRARCYGEARALYQLAQHWNIGYIELCPWWSYDDQEWHPGIRLMLGQQQVWTSRYIDQIADGFRAGAKFASNGKRGLRYLE
jgi:hypothetical protein